MTCVASVDSWLVVEPGPGQASTSASAQGLPWEPCHSHPSASWSLRHTSSSTPCGSQDVGGLCISTRKTPAHSWVVSKQMWDKHPPPCDLLAPGTEGDGQPEPSAVRARRTLKGRRYPHPGGQLCCSVGGPNLKAGTSFLSLEPCVKNCP